MQEIFDQLCSFYPFHVGKAISARERENEFGISDDLLSNNTSFTYGETSLSSVARLLEVVENQFFLYNNETNQFLGQGGTVQKLKEQMTSRFPNRDVKIVAGKKNECELLKRELEQLDANRSNV